jgi:hypothetical protein
VHCSFTGIGSAFEDELPASYDNPSPFDDSFDTGSR